jgi:hypothetical protein
MRAFVTFPMNCEYVAEVVHVEEFPKDKFGVALPLKRSVTYGDSKHPGSLTRARINPLVVDTRGILLYLSFWK